MSEIELASETERNLYRERIDELWAILHEEYSLSGIDLFAQAYILAFKDTDLGRE